MFPFIPWPIPEEWIEHFTNLLNDPDWDGNCTFCGKGIQTIETHVHVKHKDKITGKYAHVQCLKDELSKEEETK